MARRPRLGTGSPSAHAACHSAPLMPCAGCRLRAVRGPVRAWARDASLVVGARVLCSTSWAICTDPIDLSRGRLARDGRVSHRASTMRLGSVAAARGSWACDMRTAKNPGRAGGYTIHGASPAETGHDRVFQILRNSRRSRERIRRLYHFTCNLSG